MAVRACIIEGKGDCNPAKLSEYQHIMRSLWDEISDLADFDKVCGISFVIGIKLQYNTMFYMNITNMSESNIKQL